MLCVQENNWGTIALPIAELFEKLRLQTKSQENADVVAGSSMAC